MNRRAFIAGLMASAAVAPIAAVAIPQNTDVQRLVYGIPECAPEQFVGFSQFKKAYEAFAESLLPPSPSSYWRNEIMDDLPWIDVEHAAPVLRTKLPDSSWREI
jgi:hypothetical protein